MWTGGKGQTAAMQGMMVLIMLVQDHPQHNLSEASRAG